MKSVKRSVAIDILFSCTPVFCPSVQISLISGIIRLRSSTRRCRELVK